MWGWPAVLNLTLGGTGAGFYLLSYTLAILNGGMSVDAGIVSAALIGFGFLSLSLEAGRPFRGGYLLNHVGRSWMSRETLAGATFFVGVILNLFYPHWIFRFLMAVSAIGLIVSHGFILYDALAVRAWSTILIPMLVITSAFVLGEGLMMLFVAFGIAVMNTGFLIMCLVFLLLDLMLWFAYLKLIRNDKGHIYQINFRRFGSLAISVGIGHILPIMIAIGLFLLPDWKSASGLSIFSAVAGLTMIGGGFNQKSSIILGASYLREIVLTSQGARMVNGGGL